MSSDARFLIVEDRPEVMRALRRIFERHRPVAHAESIEAARALFEEDRTWTGVVVDVGLPDGSGLDFLEWLRTQAYRGPALVLTGRLESRVVARTHSLRAEYLVKPGAVENLRAFAKRCVAAEQLDDARLRDHIEWYARSLDLSEREVKLLRVIVTGANRSQAASTLNMSENTVKSQARTLLRKANEKSLAALGQKVLRDAWVRRAPPSRPPTSMRYSVDPPPMDTREESDD